MHCNFAYEEIQAQYVMQLMQLMIAEPGLKLIALRLESYPAYQEKNCGNLTYLTHK